MAGGNGLSLRLRVAEAHPDKIGVLFPQKRETSLGQNSTILPRGSHLLGKDKARHFFVRWLQPICMSVKVNFLIR